MCENVNKFKKILEKLWPKTHNDENEKNNNVKMSINKNRVN